MPRLLLTLTLAGLLALVVTWPASARREHGTHGTVRKLCDDARVERWPGGPVVAILRKGHDVRRYSFRGHWALGVSEGTPHHYGYVQSSRFCPPSKAGVKALARDRAATGIVYRRTGTPLPHALSRRICSEHVWVRDHPLDRAIGILWLGDVFVARRAARNPVFGGDARGHEHERGWVPRASLCGALPRVPAGSRVVVLATGAGVLVPPPTLPCSTAQPRRGLIEVGVEFATRRGDAIRADMEADGRVLRGPVFQPREEPALDRGAVGRFACGKTVHIVYRQAGGAGRELHRTAVTIGPANARRGIRTARAASAPTSATAKAPGASCAARPTLIYAHGHEGPVSHRYDARPAVSAGGGAIAFDTPLRLSTADDDASSDVYVRSARGLQLISHGSHAARAPSMSADGGRIAFESDELGARDSNSARDVFISDRGGAPVLISTAPDGAAANGRSRAPSLSADGRFVAFESAASNLVAGAPPEGIYIRDLLTGTVWLAIADAYRPALSADGNTLVFETARAISARDRNATFDVYAAPVGGGTPVLASATPAGAAGDGRSVAGVVSADGRYVAFMSAATDLVRGDRLGLRDVFRRDLRSSRTVLISRDRCGGFANGYSRYPSISADGRRVAFDSHAGDIVATPTRGEGEVYVRDVAAGRTRLQSVRPDGTASRRTAFSPAISSDGEVVAFPSFGYDLVAPDVNHRVDQFARRVAGGRVRRVS